MGKLKIDTLYISFHKAKSPIGYLIALWTLGKYSHCEFIYNDEVYLANPGGVRKEIYRYKKNFDVYELDKNIEPERILEFFEKTKGKGYDYKAIFGSQFAWFINAENKDEYFCSEWCINAIDYALDNSLTYNFKELSVKGYHKFNPERLYKYLKVMELIKTKEV